MLLPSNINQTILALQKNQPEEPLVAYIYDLAALRTHLEGIKASLPFQVELFYAIKANPDVRVVEQVARIVDGLEVASGGEIELIKPFLKRKPFIFGGPAKLTQDLDKALNNGVELLHIESLSELIRLNELGEKHQKSIPILLRLNPELPEEMKTTLTMVGRATAFGIDDIHISELIQQAKQCKWIDLQGFHLHALSHLLDADRHLRLLEFLIEKSYQLAEQEQFELKKLNLGGGIGVNYIQPEKQYDWLSFAEGLTRLLARTEYQHLKVRFEMGRYLTAFCGYYAMEVIDLKSNHEENFAVCRGGTHQFRLPVAQNHSHPFIHVEGHKPEFEGCCLKDTLVTVVGQLCTPKDIMASRAFISNIAIGDVLVFPFAGAYAWNISHQNFLCHPAPIFHYLDSDDGLMPTETLQCRTREDCYI